MCRGPFLFFNLPFHSGSSIRKIGLTHRFAAQSHSDANAAFMQSCRRRDTPSSDSGIRNAGERPGDGAMRCVPSLEFTGDQGDEGVFLPMIVLALFGILLLVGAPAIGRLIVGSGRDPVAITRIVQVFAIALLIAAIFARPYNPDTAAVPPSPNAPALGR